MFVDQLAKWLAKRFTLLVTKCYKKFSKTKCLKRIKETIQFLDEFDPNSTVIFQSDHNWHMSKNRKERQMIFNLVKINEKCNLDKNVSWNNVNTLRWVFSCMTGNNPKYIEN